MVPTEIFLVSSMEVSLKYAVGPLGKYTTVIASEKGEWVRCQQSR